MNKKLYTLLISITIFFLGTIATPLISNAQELNNENLVKDSDYDGLSNQSETEIYHTDPLKEDSDDDSYLDSAEILAGTNPLEKNEISTSTTMANTAVTPVLEIPWPWYITRASAITAYLLLFFLIISGIGIKTSIIFKFVSPSIAWINHRLLAFALSIAVFTHIISLFFDKFAQFSIPDLLIPFSSSFKPFYMALGILGFYILLILVLSFIFLIDKKQKLWKLIHFLSYFLFVFISIHGYFIGSDSKTALMQAVYLICGSSFVILLIYRLYFQLKQTGKI